MKFSPNSTAFLFPGQGSQFVSMGKELAATYPVAAQVFAEADSILQFPLSKLAWGGPEEELNDTLNTQPALFVHSIAALRVFEQLYPNFSPAFLAGHSLGELTALAASGALSFADGLQLVRRRGELMKQAGEEALGGMAAFLGLDIPTVEKICEQASIQNEIVQVANDNCPGQVVVSGDNPALERAITLAQQAGARRAVRLAVSIAAHSSRMQQSQGRFLQAIQNTRIQTPRVPVIGNVHAKPLSSTAEIESDLQAQLTTRVRWTESIQYLLNQGINTFVEFGAGDVLVGLVKRIDRETLRFSIGTPQDFTDLEASD